MPHVRSVVHGLASMAMLIVGSFLTVTVREEFEVFETVSAVTTWLILEVAGLPVPEAIAEIIVPFGVLMSIWVFAYELRQLSADD